MSIVSPPIVSPLCIGRLIAFFILVSLGSSAAAAETTALGWATLPQIVEQIRPPRFRDHDFDVTQYGAKADRQDDSLPAIQEAIAACVESGGGRVVIPRGEWYVGGPIHLQSGVNLHLEKGAVLKFSNEPSDYLPAVFTRFEGTELMNYSPLIYAFEQENIGITGEGLIDGQAGHNRWWNWKGPWGGDVDIGWKVGDPDQRRDVELLGELVEKGVAAKDRVFGAEHFLRPSCIQTYRCRNVLIESVKVTNSPMWVIHPVLSTNVTVRDVSIDSHGPNNDGCNPESCNNVLIEICTFDTGDDCIAIKSGRNADGRRLATPSENIVIRQCTMKDGHGGVVLGSEMSGGVRNVFVEDCKMDSPQLERAIRLKSNSLRGGFLENLFVRNIEVGQVSDAVVRINLKYSGESGDFPPLVRNVYLENITSRRSNRPMYLVGLPERPIENVVLRNCNFQNAKGPSVIENVQQVQFVQTSQPE